METKSKNAHGGYRQGAGRPNTERVVPLSVRISEESNEKLSKVKNKSEFIDNLIKQQL